MRGAGYIIYMLKNKVTLGSILAVLLAGGSVGGYVLVRDHQADLFEKSVHEVVYVVDGDTVDIENEVRVRLLGIDAPENGECLYTESRAFLTELVGGKQVYLRKDISGSDRYGRLLRYLVIPADNPSEDEVLVQEVLVRSGYAQTLAEAPDNRYRDLLSSAQQEARIAERGMWGACEVVVAEDELREQDSEPIDPSCVIKGNISEKGNGKLYFYPGCPNYNRVKVDTRKGEAYFCTEDEAVVAGFERSASCDNTF